MTDTTMDLLVNQIQDYKRQQAEATATRDNIVAQCEGGIKTCLWMIGVLNEAKAKDDAAKAAAEAEEALRKEQDKAAAEAAAEIASNIIEAGRAAIQTAQDEQIDARGGFVAVPEHQTEACGHRLGGPECTVCNPVMVGGNGDVEVFAGDGGPGTAMRHLTASPYNHAGELEPPYYCSCGSRIAPGKPPCHVG